MKVRPKKPPEHYTHMCLCVKHLIQQVLTICYNILNSSSGWVVILGDKAWLVPV